MPSAVCVLRGLDDGRQGSIFRLFHAAAGSEAKSKICCNVRLLSLPLAFVCILTLVVQLGPRTLVIHCCILNRTGRYWCPQRHYHCPFFASCSSMARELAEMIYLKSKEPSRTLYLFVRRQPAVHEQDSAWLLELRYEACQVVVTDLGSGTALSLTALQVKRKTCTQTFKMKTSRADLCSFMTMWQCRLPDLEVDHSIKLSMGLFFAKCVRYERGDQEVSLGLQDQDGTCLNLLGIQDPRTCLNWFRLAGSKRPRVTDLLVNMVEYGSMHCDAGSIQQLQLSDGWPQVTV